MSPRFVAFLLAIVLIWSGASTEEHNFALQTGDQQQQAQGGAALGAEPVSAIDDHQVDDQPVQAQAEPVLDFTALLALGGDDRDPAGATLRPWHGADVMRLHPDLEGPRRPPRATISSLA